MSDILFTSDDHLEHPFVFEDRGFSGADEYREWFCDRWVSSVRKNDTVWNLGDITLGPVSVALDTYRKLPGRKLLIWGNHDKGWPHHKKGYNHQKQYLEVFDSANSFQHLKTYGVEFLLTHFPYEGEHMRADGTYEPDRYTQYRLRDEGIPNIHGHVHDEWTIRHSSAGTPMINVGVDRWGDRMPTISDIMEILKGNTAIV